jgi:hypothetical protein
MPEATSSAGLWRGRRRRGLMKNSRKWRRWRGESNGMPVSLVGSGDNCLTLHSLLLCHARLASCACLAGKSSFRQRISM